MSAFSDLIAAEMFLPAQVYHREFRTFAKSAIDFLNGLPNETKISTDLAVSELVRAQAAGLLPPMPELLSYTGDGTYAVDSKTDTTIGIHGGVTLSAVSLGVDFAKSIQRAENITHHVAWSARAVVPDVDRLRAIVESAEALQKSFAAEAVPVLASGGG